MIGKLKSITMMLGCLVMGAILVGLLYSEYREVEILKDKSRYIINDKEYPLKAFDFKDDAQYIVSGRNPSSSMCNVDTYEIVTDQTMIKENINKFYIDYNVRSDDPTMCGTIVIYENGIVVHVNYENGKGTNSLLDYGTLQFEEINKEQYLLLHNSKSHHIEFEENYTLTCKIIEGVLIGKVHVHGETSDGEITTHEVTTYVYDVESIEVSKNKEGILEIRKYNKDAKVVETWAFEIKKDQLIKQSG